MYPYNESLTEFAKELRKNMTSEEKHLWYDFLKLLPITVKRQKASRGLLKFEMQLTLDR